MRRHSVFLHSKGNPLFRPEAMQVVIGSTVRWAIHISVLMYSDMRVVYVCAAANED